MRFSVGAPDAMTPAQRKYLDALQVMLQEPGASTVAWRVCERAGIAVGTLSGWKKAHKTALQQGLASVNQDFFDEEAAIRRMHRETAAAERAIEPEILLPEVEEEEVPEVLVAYLAEIERQVDEGRIDRYGAFQEVASKGCQVSFDALMDAITGGHKRATRRFNQLNHRITVRMEDKLDTAALSGSRSQDNSLALQSLRTRNPDKWNPKAKVVYEFQLEESDRKLIEQQQDWFKSHIKKIPASTGAL